MQVPCAAAYVRTLATAYVSTSVYRCSVFLFVWFGMICYASDQRRKFPIFYPPS